MNETKHIYWLFVKQMIKQMTNDPWVDQVTAVLGESL